MDKQLPQSAESNDFYGLDNLPNRLTLFRLVLVPIVIGCLYLQQHPSFKSSSYLGIISAAVFIIASITDYLDGYIARKRQIITAFGSFLDPIADKFLTISALIMLQSIGRIDALLVIILVLREFYITALRLLASSEGLSIPVGNMGKWKTTMQMTGIPMLMVYNEFLHTLGTVFMGVAAYLSLYSSIVYSLGLVRKLKKRRAKRRKNIHEQEREQEQDQDHEQ